MPEQKRATLTLVDRQVMELRGVHNVDIFDEEKILLQTELGRLEIEGQHLNVTNLDIENGSLQVDGLINSFAYVEEDKKAKRKKREKGILPRLFS